MANKLKRNNLEFASQKRKVNLLVQILSISTAQALIFLRDLGYPKFQDCDETVNFIHTMDQLFDIMNSRNPFRKGFTVPLRSTDKHAWLSFLNKAHKYLTNLQTTQGVPLFRRKRKTCIFGYLLMIRVVKSLFVELVEKDNVPLEYLITFKQARTGLCATVSWHMGPYWDIKWALDNCCLIFVFVNIQKCLKQTIRQ